MPINRNALALALCAGLVSTAPAHAALADVSADISQLQFQLIDLDPTDGITPSITWSWSPSFDTYALSALGTWTHDEQYQGITAEGSTSAALWYGHTDALIGPSAAASHATVLQASYELREVESRGNFQRSFTLTPNTGLAVSALGTLRTTTAQDSDVFAALGISGAINGNGDGVSDSFWFGDSHSTQVNNVDLSFHLQGYLFTGDEARSGTFSLGTSVTAFTPTTAVPEPGGWAMLLAGVALVAGVTRRRATASFNHPAL